MNKRAVIIVAGGKGLRMGGDLPKQFMLLQGKPILMYTLEAFYAFDQHIQLVLVLPLAMQDYWRKLCADFHFDIEHDVVSGGETRFHSVKNGLAAVHADWVAVHDGVRPFVAQSVIATCFEKVQSSKAVIPVINVIDTLRKVDESGSVTKNREQYKLVQTPQVFETNLLRRAYQQEYISTMTDDASVVEAMGEKITLVEGNRENIKITTPFDLKIAAALSSCSI